MLTCCAADSTAPSAMCAAAPERASGVVSPSGVVRPSDGALSSLQMDKDWLVFDPAPSKPTFRPPPGAVDAHCHVFGPGEVFPYAPERKYTPCDAPAAKLFELRDFLGFERDVIVKATCHGADNRALLDAIARSNGRARVPRATLAAIAARIAPLGWHIVIYFEAADLPELYPFITALPTVVVVDHMGRPDVGKPVDGLEFELFLRLMREHPQIWCKVSGTERLSKSGAPEYDDVVPFSRRVVESFPDRVLWGTDWPRPNLKTHMPDDGRLVDFIPRIAPSAALQSGLLVDNPMRLYWTS
jgi:2-pyrone-4,6-dicarboxylate lactonase